MENFPSEIWEADIAVGLTGAFLCSRVFGTEMAKQGRGAIVNIASHFALMAPDQRIYRKEAAGDSNLLNQSPTGGESRTAWFHSLSRCVLGKKRSRVKLSVPAEIFNRIPTSLFSDSLHGCRWDVWRIENEYQGAILFLCLMLPHTLTGANLVVDGGRT